MGQAISAPVPENWNLVMERTYEPPTIPNTLTTQHKWVLKSTLLPKPKSAGRKKKKRQVSADQSDFNMSNTNSPATSPRNDPSVSGRSEGQITQPKML